MPMRGSFTSRWDQRDFTLDCCPTRRVRLNSLAIFYPEKGGWRPYFI